MGEQLRPGRGNWSHRWTAVRILGLAFISSLSFQHEHSAHFSFSAGTPSLAVSQVVSCDRRPTSWASCSIVVSFGFFSNDLYSLTWWLGGITETLHVRCRAQCPVNVSTVFSSSPLHSNPSLPTSLGVSIAFCAFGKASSSDLALSKYSPFSRCLLSEEMRAGRQRASRK